MASDRVDMVSFFWLIFDTLIASLLMCLIAVFNSFFLVITITIPSITSPFLFLYE